MTLLLPLGTFAQGADLCSSLNSINESYKKDKMVSLKGTLEGTNNAFHYSTYTLKTPVKDALSCRVTLYAQSPDLNYLEIVYGEQSSMDETLSKKFSTLLKQVQTCLKDWKYELVSGDQYGHLDSDGDYPEVEFTKKGFPAVTLSIDNERKTDTLQLLLKFDEPEDED